MKKIGKYYRNPAPFALTAANPAKKRRRKRNKARRVSVKKIPARKKRRNPLAIRHVIEDVPARNPSRRRKKRKNPSAHKFSTMSKTRKRHRKGARKNPARKSSRRRSHRRRNSASRSRMFRNPPIISEVIDKQNIKRGLGALAGIVGTRWTINKLIQGDPTTGQRMFDLPGVTYSTAAAPLTQAQFSDKNKIALAFYEALIPAVAGWLVRKYDQQISEGLFIATVTNLGIAAVRSTNVGQVAGMNAFLPRGGMRTMIPGVPPMLTGPATAFINNGSPVSRRGGMNAVVNQRWMAQTTNGGPNPFKAN